MAMKRILVVAALLLSANASQAAFVDWWLTADQQGRILYERGDFAAAAQRFEDPLWKGLAFYASEDFASAASWFGQVETAYGAFYLGNALSHLDQLAPAIKAYERALGLQPEFAEAAFNLQWVSGIYALSQKEYDDAGGTGGKLGADDYVFSDRAKDAQQTMTEAEATQQGLSDEQIEAIWMRRVQTTPGDFLAYKFAWQAQQRESGE